MAKKKKKKKCSKRKRRRVTNSKPGEQKQKERKKIEKLTHSTRTSSFREWEIQILEQSHAKMDKKKKKKAWRSF